MPKARGALPPRKIEALFFSPWKSPADLKESPNIGEVFIFCVDLQQRHYSIKPVEITLKDRKS
jgi:hypothetical protein